MSIFLRYQRLEYCQAIAVFCSFGKDEKFRFQTGISGTKTKLAMMISWRYLRSGIENSLLTLYRCGSQTQMEQWKNHS